jgi:hypothetical protein
MTPRLYEPELDSIDIEDICEEREPFDEDDLIERERDLRDSHNDYNQNEYYEKENLPTN